MARSRRAQEYYEPSKLVDAPESYAYARALGTLTWATWDHDARPFEQRVEDFVRAFPPSDPLRHIGGGDLTRRADGSYGPGEKTEQLQRFLAEDWRPGSLYELLARYGLKLAGAPARVERPFVPAPMRDTAQRRNMKLRVLHGSVDIEARNMDAAKAELLDRQEKRDAALQVREALKKMKQDLSEGD